MPSLKFLRQEQKRTKAIFEVMGTLEKISSIERMRAQEHFRRIASYQKEIMSVFDFLSLAVRVTPPSNRGPNILVCFGPSRSLTGTFADDMAEFVLEKMRALKPEKIFIYGSRLAFSLRQKGLSDFFEFPSRARPGQSAASVRDIAQKILAELPKPILYDAAHAQGTPTYPNIFVAYAKYLGVSAWQKELEHIFSFSVIPIQAHSETTAAVFVEPRMRRIVEILARLFIGAHILGPFTEVKFIESSLRLLATNRAKDNAGSLANSLRKHYLRTLRARSTQSINELFTGKTAFMRATKKREIFFEWKV